MYCNKLKLIVTVDIPENQETVGTWKHWPAQNLYNYGMWALLVKRRQFYQMAPMA